LFVGIEKAVLEKACVEMIETILYCLPNTFKGTIYRIGKPPDLIAERIASGIIDDRREEISWGLPAESGYNSPGKAWSQYRDQPDRPLEAMSWCVEKQKSWTAQDPSTNVRSIPLQVEGKCDDFHHMEPVLVRKSDLKLDKDSSFEYPRDYQGNSIWKDTEHVVVAVIKIHFYPFTIKLNSHETRAIKKLSRSLGTELLSYHLRQDSMKTMERLAQERLKACNILADSLRNATTKSGLIFYLVKQEIGYLRNQWEQVLRENRKEENGKVAAIRELNGMLEAMDGRYEDLREELTKIQNKFLGLSLPPEKGENWVNMQIVRRWKDLFVRCPQDDQIKELVWKTIDEMKKSLHFGYSSKSIAHYDKIPEDLKTEWIHLLYSIDDHFDASALDRLITILNNPTLDIPSREKSRRTLIQLKALAETMSQLEQNTNFILRQVLNGGDDKEISEILNNST
jgi:hypothetical protein